MRLKVEIDELTPDQWRHAQEVLRTSYEIPDGASRACLLLMHEGEERHVELPASQLSGFLMGLSLVPAIQGLGRAVKLAMAALTPDDASLPRGFEPEFKAADHNPDTGGEVAARDVQCSPECKAQDDDRPHHLKCPTRGTDR